MYRMTIPAVPTDLGVYGPDEIDALTAFFDEYGFAILRGAIDDERLIAMEQSCEGAQAGVAAGTLPEKHGSVIFDDPSVEARGIVNYVSNVTEVSQESDAVVRDATIVGIVRRLLGEEAWLLDVDRFGVVYQDARPGRESAYTRIGWHTDWQSMPHHRCWPSVAFTVHIDATSPCNGFLRVVPGSHRWATPAPLADIYGKPAPVPPGTVGGWTAEAPPFAMPLGFEKVPGEIAVYCERGDVLFHDAYLWHSAARATDDAGIRRHVRGSWFAGERFAPDSSSDDFVKNAAR
jgi:ectoine hydroxylase-related dioxygenase (phytanoyl-CoA dioxygenase family)